MFYTITRTITEEQNVDLIYQVRDFNYLSDAQKESKKDNEWYIILEMNDWVSTKFNIIESNMQNDWYSYISKFNKRFWKDIDTEKFNEILKLNNI